MSGFEVTGLVMAIVPLLRQVFDEAKAFKQRFEDFRVNPKKIIRVENCLKTILDNLQALQRQFGDKKLDIPKNNRFIFENDFGALGRTLTEVSNLFGIISGPNEPARSRGAFFRFLRANKIKCICNEIISSLEKASDRLRHMNIFFSTATVIDTGVGQVREKQDEILDILTNMQRDALNSSTRGDKYIPCFFVPINPPIVQECLDYATVDEKGNLETDEGILKAELLGSIDVRLERNDKLPVVAAVGMPGVGKTCALRGLGAEKDLRAVFSDGILYFYLGKNARKEDMREALCSMVSQTGGRSISREMKDVSGEKAID